MKFELLLFAVFAIALQAYGQSENEEQAELYNISQNQEYRIYVYDNNGGALNLLENNRSLRDQRGFFKDLFTAEKNAIKSSALGTIGTVSNDIITSGVGAIVEALRSKKNDWLQQVRRDCVFTKQLPMQQCISDFYANISSNGPLDPDSILFNGFGCQQYLKYRNKKGSEEQALVFMIRCSLRRDDYGKARILNHGKFEVQLDTLIINPFLCNIPNDSLTSDGIKKWRTPFDFKKRNNFKFKLDAEITSSWINEAILLNQDQKLGAFSISVNIPDTTYLATYKDFPQYFIYTRTTSLPDTIKTKIEKAVSVTGDCFIVPRSYIGCDSQNGDSQIWGTGQYKINMTISESCDVNMNYYCYKDPAIPLIQHEKSDQGEINKGENMKIKYHWKDEWYRMKHRKHLDTNIFINAWNDVKMIYGNGKWINILTDPAVTVILDKENKYLDEKFSKWLGLDENGAK